MKYIILLLFPLSVFSKDVKIKDLYIDAERAVFTNRPYEMPPGYKKKYGLGLGLDVDLYKYGYLNQRIQGMTGPRQFRHVSWEFETGVRLDKHVEFYFRHYSGHALDSQYESRFPESNSVGIRLYLITK